MSSFEIIAVTNRHLTTHTLPEQVERIARLPEQGIRPEQERPQRDHPEETDRATQSFQEERLIRPDWLILREKDMTEEEYRALASEILGICGRSGITCVLHTFPYTACALGCERLHLPFPVFREFRPAQGDFGCLGTSVHSAAEAVEAWKLGADYVTAGHVFDTDCKKGLPGRGLAFLEDVCAAVPIPVYAIGGISPEKLDMVKKAGASGACMMSAYMKV